MGQVVLSLEEYDQLKKQADVVAELKGCFKLEKDYEGKEITLAIPVKKAAEIFGELFTESEYNDGSYVMEIEHKDYTVNVANWYVKALKKPEVIEEVEETKESEE